MSRSLTQLRGLTGARVGQVIQSFSVFGDLATMKAIFDFVKERAPKVVNIDMHNALLAQVSLTRPLAETMQLYRDILAADVQPDHKTYLYVLKAASLAGHDGLTSAVQVMNDAAVRAPRVPLRMKSTYVFVLHVLRNGSHAVFKDALSAFHTLSQRGTAALVDEDDTLLLKNLLQQKLTADKVVPQTPITRSLSVLYGKPSLSAVQLQ
jgi:hypothetical protein